MPDFRTRRWRANYVPVSDGGIDAGNARLDMAAPAFQILVRKAVAVPAVCAEIGCRTAPGGLQPAEPITRKQFVLSGENLGQPPFASGEHLCG
ncbi:MAG TPA: hypothetical protein VND65_03510 [Candidatus Binatia bacterium]|nr:hypothetical protein [Candidatus Binatia bacterium]